MVVILQADQSQVLNQAIVNLVKTDPDKAQEFLELSGHTEESAAALIAGITTSIEVSAAHEALTKFREDREAEVYDMVAGWSIPEFVDYLVFTVAFDRAELPGKPGEMIGWVHPLIKTRVKGEKRATSTPTGAKTTGNGRKGRVPCPEGVKSWNNHLEIIYPGEFAKLTGSFSAPRVLERLKDPTYLSCALAAKTPESV